MSVPSGSLPPVPYSRRAFIFSFIGGLGILGFTLYFLLGTLGAGGHQATARFLLFPHLVSGSVALVGSLMMRAKPARLRDLGFLVAAVSIGSLILSARPLFLPILVAAIFAVIGGLTAYEKG